MRLQVTLLGAGDNLTGLSCLYVMKAASGSVLESPGWLPTEVMEKSMVIIAGFLQDMDCWFPSFGVGRVMCLFPNLCSIATDGGVWGYFLGSTKVSEAPGDGPGCLQLFHHASSHASWALWAWGELVIFLLGLACLLEKILIWVLAAVGGGMRMPMNGGARLRQDLGLRWGCVEEPMWM